MAASSVCLVGSRPRRSIITGKLPCGSPPPHYVEKLDSAEAIQNQQDLKLSTADCQQVFPSARCDSAGCQMKRKTAVLTNGSGPTIRESHCGSTNTGGNAAVASMAAVSLASAVGAVLSLQLLVGFANHPDGVKEEPEVTRRREILGELGASLCGFSLAFSLSSLLVALLHLQFLLSEKNHFRQAVHLRFCAFGGFFISLPVLLTAAICFVGFNFGLTSLLVWCLFGSLGVLLCVLAIGHSAFAWLFQPLLSRQEFPPAQSTVESHTNLSTLV